MFCIYCGKEIDSDSKYCCYCGEKQPIDHKPTIEDMIDTVGEEIGEGIDEALEDFKDEIQNSNEIISYTVDQVGQQAEDVRDNWKDYLTSDNMELLAALVLVLPLFMGVVNTIVGSVFRLFIGLPLVGSVFGILPILIRIIFMLASAAGVASAVYLILNNQTKRTTWAYITLAGDVLAFVACLGIILGWGAVSFVLGLIALILGIDCISRVMIQNKGIDSEPSIGQDLEAYKSWYENYRRENSTSNNVEAVVLSADNTIDKNSYFDGSGLSALGLYLLTAIVSLITCGLATPWMICKILRWRKSHTVIDGRRLAFNGTGGSLLGRWILWEILTVITCGIYSFFMHVAMSRWEMQHTTYEDQQNVAGQFDGDSFQYFGYGVLGALLISVTCGLAGPWVITMIQKWEMRHSIISTNRLKYEGTALGILGQYIMVFLLSIITFGIYIPWGIVRLNKYIYSHTHVDA